MKNTLVTLGTLVLLAGCDKPAPPAQPDQAATPTQEAPVAAAPVPAAPVRQAAPVQQARAPSSQPVYDDEQSVPVHPVYSDYRPPLAQPQPIAAPWAPPPLLGEAVPPQPSPDATWTGGYWVWREQWVWAPGHWARPPRPDYRWVPPYYEHRNDRVLFVDGFWSAPGVSFVRPAATLSIALAVVGAGIAFGRPPIGPDGPFVPPPPGSRWGLIVPAPVGTSPYVVRGEPPIVAPGMRVTNNNVRVVNDVRNTTINRNSTVINNITNVTIEAPASSTANHQAVHSVVSPQSHLAAGAPAVTPQAREMGEPLAPTAAPAPAPRAMPPQATPSRGVAPGREVDARKPEAPRPEVNAARPAPIPPSAPHIQAPAPAPRQADRPVDPARTNERPTAHDGPKAHESAERANTPVAPKAPPSVRTTPPPRPESAHTAPQREPRAVEPAHAPAPAAPKEARPKVEPASPPHTPPHDAKDAGKDRAHDKKDEHRD